jgi:LmbE family N-acetylglucosaminyl deacetylase
MPSGNLLRVVKAWGAKRLFRRLHRVFHRMPVALREVDPGTVLVVAPHMDDEMIGPGGTLILHRDRGSEVHVVFCAGGNDDSIDQIRRSESQAVAALMKHQVEFLGLPNGSLSPSEGALARAIAEKLRAVKFNVIFCPFPADHHRDHSACAMAVAEAIRATEFDGEVWAYEVWSPLWPNASVDISEVAEEKGELIGLYASQTAGLHYVEGTLGLNRYRGFAVYVPYAEAFFVSRADEFCAIASMLDSI